MSDMLLIIQIVLVIFIVIAVLLQKSSSIGLGAYSGSNESVFGAKGPNSFLAKVTFTIGFLFVVNTVALGYFFAKDNNKSVVDEIALPDTQVAAPTFDIQTDKNITTEINSSK
jgi:preprotein translocase subunit SecG